MWTHEHAADSTCHAGHSLGAGAAALIALKLKDRFPEVKCWAFCPPGGLLTPNMAHAMKPFCTSVVVNKDCIPRMSLKNLNRFMEGKLMALACSKLNAFQIFWGSYGKVNRRRFFDKDIFRPLDEMPEEAREMLERCAPSVVLRMCVSSPCTLCTLTCTSQIRSAGMHAEQCKGRHWHSLQVCQQSPWLLSASRCFMQE